MSRTYYKVNLVNFPFSLKVTDQKKNLILLKSISLMDDKNHFIPLDYYVENSKDNENHDTSIEDESMDSKKEHYSFLISSHMRKELLYRVTIKTKKEGINVSLFPVNSISKKYSLNKSLKLIIEDNQLKNEGHLAKKTGDHLGRSLANEFKKDLVNNQDIFVSKHFNIKKIESKSSNFKINQDYNKLTLSSKDNMMHFSLNLNGIPVITPEKISYQLNE